MSKPVFSSIIDLGLRDVRVVNRPRRLAALLGRFTVPAFAAAVVYALVACFAIRSAGASPFLVVLAWPAIMFIPVLRAVKRSPVLVVKVTADGRSHATLIVLAPLVLGLGAMLLTWNRVAIAIAAPAAVLAAVVWRARKRVPAVLGTLRSALGADEMVLGDGRVDRTGEPALDRAGAACPRRPHRRPRGDRRGTARLGGRAAEAGPRAALGADRHGRARRRRRARGDRVAHRERVVDGRTGYAWEYRSRRGYRQYAAWFPQPVHSVRVECVAKRDVEQFKRLCAEAMATLRFRR